MRDTVSILKDLSASVGLDYDSEFKKFDQTRQDLRRHLEETTTAVDLDKERTELLDK